METDRDTTVLNNCWGRTSRALRAQALSTAFSRLWFLPLDARTRLVHARLAAAVVKALGFFLGARALARRLPPDEVAESPAPAVARRTAAIFAALGVFDAVSYFVDEFLDLGSQDVVLAYWAYAALASAAAVTHRERKRRRTRRVRTSEDQGRKRVIRRRFNVGVLEAIPKRQASTL